MNALSPAVQRFAAVGVLLVLCISGLSVIVIPAWEALFTSSAAHSQARYQQARLTRQAETLADFDPAAATERRQQLEGYAIHGADEREARTAFEARLRLLFARPGITLVSMAPASAPDGTLRTRIVATAQERALIELLGGLETGLPLLTVEAAKISAARAATRDLAIEITIAGYWTRQPASQR